MDFGKLKDYQKLAIIALLFFIFYSTPQLMRYVVYSDTMIGTTSYYHVRMSEMINQGGWYDSLSFGGRYYTYPPLFQLILAMFLGIKDFLPALIGVSGLMLCYFFARELNFTEEEALLSTVILGLIPGYVYLAGHINPRLIAIVFLVASYYFLMRSEREKNSLYYSAILFALSLLTHPLVAAAGFVFALILFRHMKKKCISTYAIAALLSALVWYVPLYLVYGSTPVGAEFYNVFIELKSGIQYFIFESAVVSDSIGIVTFILALFTIFKVSGKPISFLRDWIFLSVITSLIIGNRMNEQMLFPIALLVGKIIPQWGSVCDKFFLKNIYDNDKFWLTLFFMYTAIAALLAAGSLMYFPPSPAQYNAMVWIKDNTPVNSVIMAYWDDGHWVTGIAERANVIDAYAEYAPKLDSRYRDMSTIMEGADLNKSLEALKKYGVSYIYFPVINRQYCTGLAFQSRFPYFEVVYSKDNKYVFKVDYSGKAKPTDLCALFNITA